MLAEKSVGSPHTSSEADESQWSKGGDGLKSAGSRQLVAALLNVSRNKGAPGADDQTVEEVVEQAPSLLPKLQTALLQGTYQPGDIRRVWIEKPGGGQRGLGIPNAMDRWVHATLLDEGEYHCSIRTMYRLLDEQGEVRERRDQLTHPPYQKPELLATAPNQLWSWGITKLLGPAKWTYFYLRKQHIQSGQLTLHADRGASMSFKPVAFLLADLGVTKTHSRPHVCNDNPYSESQFRTLKYRPEFPDRFGCIQDRRAFCQEFFRWYNREHRHSGLGLLPPAPAHCGQAQGPAATASLVRYCLPVHPERSVRSAPKPPQLRSEVWINKPLPVT
jgi:hypothetical protein